MRIWLLGILYFAEKGAYIFASLCLLGLVCEIAYDMVSSYDDKPVALSDIHLFPPTL